MASGSDKGSIGDMGELRFDGRTAIVTGAGRGLGRAYAQLLAARGATVVVNDLGAALDGSSAAERPADAVVAEIEAGGGHAIASYADVADATGAASAVELALDRFGRIDILVNNAGIVRRSIFPETTAEDFASHVGVHQTGPFNMTRAAWPHLAAQGYGRIVLTLSTALYGLAGTLAYASAKGGALGLGRSLAVAGESTGIKVNMITPIAYTRMMASGEMTDDVRAQRQRLLSPDKVAAMVAVLTHETCPVTGEVLLAGGGRFARIFLAETTGLTVPDPTPEAVLASWNDICAEPGYTVPGPIREGTALAKSN